MPNQIEFSVDQIELLRSLRDAGPSSCPAAYRKIYEWIVSSANVDDRRSAFFLLVPEINENSSTSAANYYIRKITREARAHIECAA